MHGQNTKRNVDFHMQINGLFKALMHVWRSKWSLEGAFSIQSDLKNFAQNEY
jgi:hypothetical protein